MEVKYLSHLKKEVQETLGRKILTSTDCRYLYHDISKQQYKVSFNTLRRFFYLMNSKHKQSPYTLDVLSNYCGFTSWNDFISSYQENEIEGSYHNSDLLQFLVSNFQHTEVKNTDDPTFFSLVHKVIHFLEKHPQLLDKFQRKIANTNNGQVFYYEQSINIDKLNSYYGSGIRHYMVGKKTPDAQIFGHYLNTLKSWLTQNNINLKKHFAFLKNAEIQKANAPHLIGYKIAMSIYYHNALALEMEPILLKAREAHTGFNLNNENFTSIFRFEFHLITSLILCGLFEDALFYIEEITKINKKFMLSYSDIRLFELIPLYKALVYYNTNQELLALKIFEDLDTTKFHFLHKQFMTILYLSFKLHLRKTNSEKKQFKSLIEQTGFVRLNSFIEN